MLKKLSVVVVALCFPIICLAQEQITKETMDRIINSGIIPTKNYTINLKSLISDVDLKIKSLERGEFEKKEDYAKRIESSESEMQLLKSKIYFSELPSENIKNNYDPDTELMSVLIPYIKFTIPFVKQSVDNGKSYCFLPIISSINMTPATFRNSYGAKADGMKINETEYGILFLNTIPGMDTGSGIKKFFNLFFAPSLTRPKGDFNISYPLDSSLAKSIKKNIKVGIFYTATYKKVRNYDEYSGATISSPFERFKERKILSIIPLKVVFFDSNNGKILHVLQEKQSNI